MNRGHYQASSEHLLAVEQTITEKESTFKPSLLEFLMMSKGYPATRDREYKAADLLKIIQSDLMTLLNTKRSPLLINPKLGLAAKSVLSYGLPDLSLYNPKSEADIEEIRLLLQQAIENNEKRLSNVSVSSTEIREENLGKVYFRIEADLQLDSRKKVCFNSVINPSSDSVQLHISKDGSDEK